MESLSDIHHGSIVLLSKMLPAMKKEWTPQDSILYRNAEGADMTALSSKVVVSFCEELNSREEFAFMRDCTEFKELMTQMSC